MKNREDFEDLNDLISLKNQIKAIRLQHKLGKQTFHDDKKKVYESVTKSIKDASEDVRRIMTET